MNDKTRDKPEAQTTAAWGSDAIAELLRALEIPYIALTPGASFRGLHDYRIAMTPPQGPVYVSFDAALQEEGLPAPVPLPSLDRYPASTPGIAPQETVREVARLLETSQRPLLLIGRVSNDLADFERRVALAERIG